MRLCRCLRKLLKRYSEIVVTGNLVWVESVILTRRRGGAETAQRNRYPGGVAYVDSLSDWQ